MFGKGTLLLGLPLLLLGSITVHSDICRMPTQPVITAPTAGIELPEPTTVVQGTTTQYSTVTLKTNDRPLGSTTSDASGDFQIQVTLDEGPNHLTAQTSNPCGTGSTASVDLSVAKAEPEPEPEPIPTPPDPLSPPLSGAPNALSGSGQETGSGDIPSPSRGDPKTGGLFLKITGPADHSTTSEDSVFLTGKTNIKATEAIMVNNKEVARLSTPNWTFGVLVPLHVGKNTIKVTAAAGDQAATRWLHVTRVIPDNSPPPWYETYWYVLIIPPLLLATFLTTVLWRRQR